MENLLANKTKKAVEIKARCHCDYVDDEQAKQIQGERLEFVELT